MDSTTPPLISTPIRELCREIVPSRVAQYIEVRETNGHRPGDCFKNVHRHCEANGGGVQHGWAIWELPGKMIEAEFHAVWSDPSGTLIDVTPKPGGESRVLFLPDPVRLYTDVPVNNVRKALTNSTAVQRFIRKHDELFELRLKYHDHGVPKIPFQELERLEAKYRPSPTAAAKVGRNDPCRCKSGIKFKKCCGKL